jgi:uncharacterized protein YjiS (DUF1127 family)
MYHDIHATRFNRAVAERKANIAANRHKLTLLNLAEGTGAAVAARAVHAATGHEADIDAWARHAQAANGFGGVDLACPPEPLPLDAPTRTATAGSEVPATTGPRAALFACRDFVRRLAARIAQYRAARRTVVALRDLDARTLRDLGFDHSEIGSVAGEAAGLADATRVRVLRAQGAFGA